MIIVTATCWPAGNAARSYEMLHATIANRSSPGDKLDSYTAHVLARPNPSQGIIGYEADVEVKGHRFRDGLPPLLCAVLSAADASPGTTTFGSGVSGALPTARNLVKVTIEQVAAFEKVLRGRA